MAGVDLRSFVIPVVTGEMSASQAIEAQKQIIIDSMSERLTPSAP
jgi:phosphohistidine swiveling domain-containing protein